MKQIRSWMSHHPFKVVLFTFLFTLIPAIMAVTNDQFFYAGLTAFMFFVIVWAISVWKYSKNIVTILLIMAIMATPLKQAKAAMLGVGVVVVCVGGYCVYKVIKVCQKKFPPKDTNAPPKEFTAAGLEYGGSMEYSSIGSCWVPPPPDFRAASNQEPNPTTFTLNILLEPEGLTTTMSANTDSTSQTWAEFQAEMATHGLFITGRPSAMPQFELGGVPCGPSMVPLEFDPINGRVTQHIGGVPKRITVERSLDLTNWFPLLTTDVGVGTGFQVVDTTREGQMFYRVQVTQP